MDILTNVSLFSGVGGLDLAAKWTGKIKTVCYIEKDRYAQAVLQSRIRDGGLDDAPIWDDVSTFDGRPWKGVSVVSGGFPCQDVSNAGKRKGIEKGTRSGLFYELIRICREVEPQFILLENVAGLLVYPGAHRVFGELADLGYDAGWKIISASDVGAPHQRKRIWIVAHSVSGGRGSRWPKCKGQRRGSSSFGTGDEVANPTAMQREAIERNEPDGVLSKDVADSPVGRLERGGEEHCAIPKNREHRQPPRSSKEIPDATGGRGKVRGDVRGDRGHADVPGSIRKGTDHFRGKEGDAGREWWQTEPNVGRVADGVAFRVDRLRCCGNGVVSQQATPAWKEIIRLAGRGSCGARGR